MRKIIILFLGLVLIFSLVSCKNNNDFSTNRITITNTTTTSAITVSTIATDTTTVSTKAIETKVIETTTKMEDENMDELLTLKIDDKLVNVSWEDNDSVKSLMNLAKNGLEINMSKYGGFEQVGSIGATLPSNDSRITTNPGDIMLYSSNQIVVFYGSNTWAYTKLGHINLTKNELVELLSNKDVKLTINFK